MSCSSTKICSSVTLEPRYGKLISSHSTFYLRSQGKRKISSSAVQSVGGQHARSPKTDPQKSDTHLNHTWITRYSMASSNLLLLLYTDTRHTHTLATFTHTHTHQQQQPRCRPRKIKVNWSTASDWHDTTPFVLLPFHNVKWRQPTNKNLFVSSDFFCCRRHFLLVVQSRRHTTTNKTRHNFL